MPDTPGPGPLPYDPPKWDGIDHGQQPQVWENPMFVPGRLGINPAVQTDKLQPEEAQRSVNLIQRRQGGLIVRPGQTVLATGAGAVNVLAAEELNDPNANTYTRFYGAGTILYRGTGGVIVPIDTAYSGDPLTLLPFRPTLSGATYMLVADSAKVRQVPFAGAPIPLGLPAPATAAAPEVADILTTRIASFDTTDGSQAANWTLTAGETAAEEPKASDPPTAADITGLSGNCVEFTLIPGEADAGYYSVVGWPVGLDLTTLQGGLVEASDLDIMHLWLRVDRPDWLEEIRVYLVCSDGFDPSIVPGTDEDGINNTDAFVKTIRPHDFSNFIEILQSALGAGQDSRDNAITDGYLGNPDGGSPSSQELLDADDIYNPDGTDALPTQTTPQLVPGRLAWSEFGNIGRPLRRGEWMRIGGAEGRGWNTITGIVIVPVTNTAEEVKIACDDWFLTGGYDLDSSETTASPYDYRYTNYNTVTGDEGNPSPEQTPSTFVEALRQRLKLTPAAYGNASVVQRIYRRGGSLPTDWYFVGQNAADGAEFVDDVSDAEASAADTVELDNYQPVPTLTSAGVAVLAQPTPVFFGPLDGIIFACGDPYRPGHLYRSKAGRPGSWPPDYVQEVCSPSEELLNGTVVSGGGILWSRKRAFTVQPNLTQNGDVSVTVIPGAPGLAQRWAWCERDGVVYYVALDGIYRTAGGAPELVTPKLRPIFEPETTTNADYPPIDWDAGDFTLRLEVYEQQLWFLYLDVNAKATCLTIDLLTGEIREFEFAADLAMIHTDEGMPGIRAQSLILGGLGNGTVYTWSGLTDAGTAIPWLVATGYMDSGRPREDKHLGDAVVDLAVAAAFSFQIKLNNGDVSNTALVATGDGTRQRFTFDPFGVVPQFAHNLQVTLSGDAPATSAPILYQLGLSWASLPDQTMKRATQWQPLGISEQYVKGCTIVCDTGDAEITVLAEGTRTGLGDPFTMDTLSVRANGKRLLQFSWATQRAEQVRIRPTTDCGPWRLFSIQWDHTPEPPRVGFWDTHPEQLADQYFTGVDLDVNTFGVNKAVQIEVDGTLLTDPVSATTNFTINASGRRWVHLTFNVITPIRGHVVRILSTDGVLGMLFGWNWQKDPEPSEQANWNQNFTIEAAMNDKAVKGVILECDTFGAAKTVRIEIDGVLLTTKTVTQNGRGVVNLTWPQGVGRVLRLLPSDTNPGRLYSHTWIFDEEPYSLDRWETQLIDFGFGGRKSIYHLECAYRSAYPVTLTVQVYNVEALLLQTLTYALDATSATQKAIKHVDFHSNAGWLYKFIWTVENAAGFWLYREETRLEVLPWGGKLQTVNPFGDDDLDKVRSLSRAKDIASTSGGIRG